MPKELISTRDDSTLQVGWVLDGGTVQVGVGLPDLSVDENSVVNVWATLNRYEVNKLISTLRRARDAAYGPDA